MSDFQVEILKHPTNEDWMLCKQCKKNNLELDIKQKELFLSAKNKIGIYSITNKSNGKQYIGKSLDIGTRWQEHLNHARKTKEKVPRLQQDFRKYGIQNFDFEILQECQEQELDDLEMFYIAQKNSIVPCGYNVATGGTANAMFGENNGCAKMTDAQVYNIRELYTTDISKSEAYEPYKDIISFNTFADIWNGKTWKNIHYDVYTEENRYKHKHQKYRNHSYVLSKQDVVFIRECKEQGMRKKLVHDTYFPMININTFSCAWDGRTYSYL